MSDENLVRLWVVDILFLVRRVKRKRRIKMGSGRFDHTTYTSATSSRKARGVSDFEYSESASKVHKNLDPSRIKDKPFPKLESRDSKEHPDSNAVFVCFDVTGSNIENAKVAQKKLPNLMALLTHYLSDPQVLVAANDDITVEGKNSIQISEFESDNRIDEHIRNIWLTSNGGGNDGESYDLIMFAAATMTELDCFEKRGKKGYFFMYADEPIFTHVEAKHVHDIFGIKAEGRIPINEVIKKLKTQYHVFIIWPQDGYKHARAQYEHLFGKDCVVTLQHPNLICELIGSLVGMTEEKVSSPKEAVFDLVKFGTSDEEAHEVSKSLVPMFAAR